MQSRTVRTPDREMTLFVSTPSKACIDLLKFLRSNRIPGIKNIFLDTKESRTWAASGVPHPITSVPTLLVKTSDGRAALYIGFEKIAKLLTPLIPPSADPRFSPRNDNHNPTNGHPSGNKNPSEEEVARMPASQRDFHTLPSMKNALIINSYDRPGPPPRQPRVYRPDFDGMEAPAENSREPKRQIFDSRREEEEEEIIPEPKKKITRPKKTISTREEKAPARKRAPAKKKEVIEEDSESISEDSSSEESTRERSPPPAKKKTTVVKSRRPSEKEKVAKKSSSTPRKSGKNSMKNIHEKAKQMEKDRQKSLGYDEKDLPSV